MKTSNKIINGYVFPDREAIASGKRSKIVSMLSRGVKRLEMGCRARSKFGVPMFEPEVLRKQMYCIEESTCDIIGTFQRPCSHSAPLAVIQRPHSYSQAEELCPPYPLVTCRVLWEPSSVAAHKPPFWCFEIRCRFFLV